MLRGWVHSGFQVHQSRRIAAHEEAACESAAAAQQGCGALASAAIEIIEHRALKPRRIPSRSWRELIKKVWEVDPLLCPQCHHEMRIAPSTGPPVEKSVAVSGNFERG